LVQSFDDLLERLFEVRQSAANVAGGNAIPAVHPNLNFLQTRTASKCTYVARIGHVEVPHGFRVPMAGGFDCEWLTPRGGLL
jgi:hypothetical protein